MINYNLNGISIALIQDDRRKNISGNYPIKIRVTYKRKRIYYSTGKELSLDEWGKLDKTKLSALLNLKKDLQLSFDKVKEAVQYLEGTSGFSFEALNVFLGKCTIEDLNTAFALKIDNLKIEGRIGTQSFYECALNSISKFAGNHIPFDNITVSWLKSYEKYMLDEGKTYTTVGMYMRALRAIFNEVVKIGKVRANQYPFGKGKYEIPVGEGRKLALSLKQIKEIVTYTDGLEATEHYRDLWFFSYLCNGINIVDLLKLKFKDIENGDLSFYRSKTIKTSKKKTKIQVVITPEMERIINRWGNLNKNPENYIFPFLNGNENPQGIKRVTGDVTKRINLRMSNIAKSLNLPHISTYTARHSFATVLKRSGANIAFISESLGHSDLKTTENYLASFEREEREKNARLLTNFDN